MECNRDEAVRARDIAEQKYAKQDFLGAKKFVLKAQQLFPGLEGLSQMLPVMDVHAVAQAKLGGTEMDWYGILQVEPGADDSTVKKQYRKLALLLHPDKNKALGAEAAFKLIGEAWGILSDKTKRAVHDMRRGVKNKVTHVRVAVEPNVHSFQTTYQNVQMPTAPNVNSNPPPPGSTFWTSCPRCKMQYQYLRTYENFQLQCHKCKEVFMARDIHSATANVNGNFGWTSYGEGHRQDMNKNGPPTNGFMDAGLGTFPNFPSKANPAGFYSTAAAQAAAQSKVAAAAAAVAAATTATSNLSADVVQQTYQKVKRERVEAEKETKRKEKEMRRREKEEQRKEKEEQRKARDAERTREAMDRLIAKRKENVMKEEGKRKVDGKPTKKLERKKRVSEGGEEEADDEDRLSDQMQDDFSNPPMARRRSSRAKKNVATYKVDVSDDSDIEAFPPAKRSRLEGEAESDNSLGEKFREGIEREPDIQEVHVENGGRGEKGKSIVDDSNDEKRGSGINGGEEVERERGQKQVAGGVKGKTDRNKDARFGVSKTESHTSDLLETSGKCKENKAYEKGTPKKSGKASLESPIKEKGVDCKAEDGGKVFKTEDLRHEKSLSKTRKTPRMWPRSSPISHCSGSQAEVKQEREEVRPQNRAKPTLSHLSSEEEDDEEEEAGEEGEEEQYEEEEEEEEEQIDVPDPDFHDFDSIRTENDIQPGQIWAIYDDQDGMPRFYGRISRANSKPFKVHLCWLELTPTSHDRESWMESTGLSITCGEFKVGKATVIEQINIFSHMIVQKAGKGLVKIYPKKLEVWAIYSDWDPEQTIGPHPIPKSHGDGNTFSYEMVEILGEYSEEKGVKTVKLEKMRGFKTLFQRQEGIDAIKVFTPEELPKFSHSVPVERMERNLDIGIPVACLELDPASTPMDLILGPDQSR